MTSSEPGPARQRGAIHTVIGLGISASFVALGIYVLDWHPILAAFRGVEIDAVLAGALCLTGCFVAFALRWRKLCLGGDRIPRRFFFAYEMIGYMVNDLIPMRPGDLVRIMLLHRRHGVAVVHGVASILLERLIDVAIALMLAVVLASRIQLPAAIWAGLRSVMLAGLAGAAGFLVIACGLAFWRRLSLPGFVATWLQQVRAALAILSEGERIAALLVTSAAGWGCFAAASVLLLLGMHVDAPWIAGPLVVVVTSLGSAIPSSPGAIGVFHFLGILTLSIWQVEVETAAAYVILLHSLLISVHIGLGSAAAAATGVGRVWSSVGRRPLEDAPK